MKWRKFWVELQRGLEFMGIFIVGFRRQITNKEEHKDTTPTMQNSEIKMHIIMIHMGSCKQHGERERERAGIG